MSPDVVQVPSDATATDNDDVPVDDTPGGVILLAANPYRTSALIVNVGDEPMRVTTDGSEPTPTHGKPVGAGGVLSLASPDCPTGVVLAAPVGADTVANASEVN